MTIVHLAGFAPAHVHISVFQAGHADLLRVDFAHDWDKLFLSSVKFY